MRVLVLSHFYPRPADPEFAGFVRRQVQEVMARGCEVRVVSPVPWSPALPTWSSRLRKTMSGSRSTPSDWEVDGVKVLAPRYLKLPGALDFGLFGPLYYRGIRKLVHAIHRDWKFDLIHGQMLVPDGYAAVRLGQELGVPSVATERGYLPTQLRGSRGLRASVKWTIENANQTVFVAQAMADLACSFAEPKRPPRVVYTGLDQACFQTSDRETARQALDLPLGVPMLLFVGHNVAKKGLYVLFKALPAVWQRHPNAVLVVIGKDSVGPEAQAAAAGLNAGDRIRLIGQKPNEELPTWYAASDLVVLPSFREGLPNNLVEASACARPIVATTTDGIPEVVVDGQTGLLVPKGDAAALAAAIGRLLDDPDLARQMGARGREFALSRFSWQKHGEEMVDVYRSVCGCRGTAGFRL